MVRAAPWAAARRGNCRCCHWLALGRWWLSATLLLGFARGADDATFDNFTAIGGLLLMMKLLGFLKVLNIKLATFVLALGIILYDIVSFLLVLLTVMLGFGFAFYTLISKKKLSLHDDEPDNVRSRRNVLSILSSSNSHTLAHPHLSLRASALRHVSRDDAHDVQHRHTGRL